MHSTLPFDSSPVDKIVSVCHLEDVLDEFIYKIFHSLPSSTGRMNNIISSVPVTSADDLLEQVINSPTAADSSVYF